MLPILVLGVRRFALLVGFGGRSIDDLKLDQHKHDVATLELGLLTPVHTLDQVVHAHGQVGDEVQNPEVVAREFVLVAGPVLAACERAGADGVEGLWVDQGVHGLARDHIVEGDEPAQHGAQGRDDVVSALDDQAKAQPIEDSSRAGRPLDEHLGQQRLAGLARPLKLDHGRAHGAQLIEDLEHALLHTLEEIEVRDRKQRPQLPGVEVIEDVHHLEQGAGVALLPAGPELARGHQRQLHKRSRVRDDLVDVKLEHTLEVVGRVGAQGLDARPVVRVVPIEGVEGEQTARVGLGLVVEPIPVDHRLATEQQTQLVGVLEGDLGQRVRGAGPVRLTLVRLTQGLGDPKGSHASGPIGLAQGVERGLPIMRLGHGVVCGSRLARSTLQAVRRVKRSVPTRRPTETSAAVTFPI